MLYIRFISLYRPAVYVSIHEIRDKCQYRTTCPVAIRPLSTNWLVLCQDILAKLVLVYTCLTYQHTLSAATPAWLIATQKTWTNIMPHCPNPSSSSQLSQFASWVSSQGIPCSFLTFVWLVLLSAGICIVVTVKGNTNIQYFLSISSKRREDYKKLSWQSAKKYRLFDPSTKKKVLCF